MSFKVQTKESKEVSISTFHPTQNNNSIETLQDKSDISETIKELNSDIMGEDKFSSIDMKTRLHPIEISSIIAVDSLVALDFLPSEVSFVTRSKKRLAVSQQGEGRKEIVQISQGLRDDVGSKSMWERLGGFFKGG